MLFEGADNHMLALRMLVHSADISNPAKPIELSKVWQSRVTEEFFLQGDRERDAGMPVSAMMDRNSVNPCKSQLGFIDFVVLPICEVWADLVPELRKTTLACCRENREYWAEAVAAADENA